MSTALPPLSRREFLCAALSLAPAAIIVPPAVSYFLAPTGGWPVGLTAEKIRIAKRLLAQEAVRMTATEVLYRREAWLAAHELHLALDLADVMARAVPVTREWFTVGVP